MAAQWSNIKWEVDEEDVPPHMQEIDYLQPLCHLQEVEKFEVLSPAFASTPYEEMGEQKPVLKMRKVSSRKSAKRKISVKAKKQKERDRKRNLRALISEEELAQRRKNDAERKRALREKLRSEELDHRNEDIKRERSRRVKSTEEQPILSKEVQIVKKRRSTLVPDKLDVERIQRIMDATRQRERRAKLTEEQRELRRKKDAERKRRQRAKSTDEVLPRKKDPERERVKLTNKQLITRSKKDRDMTVKVPRSLLPQDKLAVERTIDAARKREKRAKMTEEEISLRRKKDAERKRALRAAEVELKTLGTRPNTRTRKLKNVAPKNIDDEDPLTQIKKLRISVTAIKKATLELIKASVKTKIDGLNGGKEGLPKKPVVRKRRRATNETENKVYKRRERDINQHKEEYPIISLGKEQFVCIVCNEEYDSKKGIQQHLPSHLGSELSEAKEKYSLLITDDAYKCKTQSVILTIYTCEVCSEKCYSLRNYRKHLTDKHKGNRELLKKMCFPCSFCDEAFIVKKAFAAHQRDLHNIFSQCPVCRANFETQESFTKHVNEKHLDCGKDGEMILEYKEGYFCKQCGVCSRSYNNISTHFKDMHSEHKLYPCEHCKVEYKTRMDLVAHQRKFHEEKLFCCEVCGESFSSKCFLKLHKRKHKTKPGATQYQKEQNVECKQCGKVLANRKGHRIHYMAMHQGKTFDCIYCRKSFKHRALLYRHRINFCEKDKAIRKPCPICGKILDNAIALSYHKSNFHKYGNSEETVCHVCNKGFKGSMNLLIHNKRFHQTDTIQIFTCAVCGKGLTDKRKLLSHWRLHREEWPFKCSFCETTFKNQYRFYRHREIAHGNDHEKVLLITDSEVDIKIIADFNNIHAAQFIKPVKKNLTVIIPTKVQTNENCNPKSQLSFNETIFNHFRDHEADDSNVAGSSNNEKNYIDFSRANVPVTAEVRPHETVAESEDNWESGVNNEAARDENVTKKSVSQENETVVDECMESADDFFEPMECPSPIEYSNPKLKEDKKPFICSRVGDIKDPFTKRLMVGVRRLRECRVCGEFFPCPATYGKHINSKGHRLAMRAKKKETLLVKKEKKRSDKKKLRKAKRKLAKQKGEFACPFCNEKLTSVHDYQRHTAQHKKRSKSLVCEVCSAVFDTVRLMVNHYMSDHNGENVWKCKVCDKGFLDLKTYRSHMDYQHDKLERKKGWVRVEEGPLTTCDICGGKVKGSKEFAAHLLSHGDEMHKCQYCAEEFKILIEFERHYIDVHNGEMPFPCQSCPQKFATPLRLQMHEKKAHPRKDDTNSETTGRKERNAKRESLENPLKKEKKKLPCSLCDKILFSKSALDKHLIQHKKLACCILCTEGFPSVRTLIRHYMSVHNGEKLIKCELCEKRFLDYHNFKQNLIGHMALQHDIARKNKRHKSYSCDVCGVICKEKMYLRRHLLAHQNEKHKCVYCNAELKGSFELESHYNGCHNGEMPFPCGECSLRFPIKPKLQVHRKEAHPNSDYTQDIQNDLALLQTAQDQLEAGQKFFCEFCGEFFSGEDSLNMHMREHSGDKPYQCTLCGMAFASPASLKEHADNVHNKPLYPCDVCGKTFNRHKNFLRHRHSNKLREIRDIAEFNCPICSRKCGKADGLKRHMKLHSPTRRFACDLCSCRFNRSSNLCMHKIKMHGNIGKVPRGNVTKI